MNIKAIEELDCVLDELDAKIKHLESSPNRAFVLVEYETLSSFHYFNLCFKKFWDEFDRHLVSQLLLYQVITKKYSELTRRYVNLLGEQIDYLENVLDFKYKCVKDLPPVIFSEDNSTDVIDFYMDNLKNEKDENENPLYIIVTDRDTHFEEVDGKTVPIDFNMFRSDKINEGHYKGLLGIYNCLEKIFDLMCAVCSYPDDLIYGYQPNQEEIINALERESRQYAKEIEKDVERELRRTAQYLKPSRNAQLTVDVWGHMMDEEDEIYRLAISDQLKDNEEKRFESIFEEQRKLLTDNASLLQKIKSTAIDGELFDISLSVDTHNLLSSLNAGNLDLFYYLILRRNIIQREMYPEELRTKFDEWVNPTEEQQQEEGDNIGLGEARQSKLNEIIGILQKGNWKQPATAEKIALFLNTIFGRDTSSLDENDEPLCVKMWALVEGGGGDRMVIVPANLAGFFSEENLLTGSPKNISNDLFGMNNNQINNINKGKTDYRCKAFREVIPFLKKYTNIIIRQE